MKREIVGFVAIVIKKRFDDETIAREDRRAYQHHHR